MKFEINIQKDPVDAALRKELLLGTIRGLFKELEQVPLSVKKDERGKPYVVAAGSRGDFAASSDHGEVGAGSSCDGCSTAGSGASAATQKVHFSISHSGELWGCIACDANCGMDLQELKKIDYNKLAARFYTEEEQRYVEKAGLRGFFEIWVRWEALAKFSGLGFFGIAPSRPEFVARNKKQELHKASTVIWEKRKLRFRPIEVSKGYLAVWCCEEGRMGTFDKASNYLLRQPRTAMEIRKYLEKHEYSKSEIDDAVTKLIEYNYIDDVNYAKIYIKQAASRGKGKMKINQELTTRGVSRQNVNIAWDSIETEFEDETAPILDEKARALEIGLKMRKQQLSEDKPVDEKFCAKVGRRLAGKGYSADVIYFVLGKLR